MNTKEICANILHACVNDSQIMNIMHSESRIDNSHWIISWSHFACSRLVYMDEQIVYSLRMEIFWYLLII